MELSLNKKKHRVFFRSLSEIQLKQDNNALLSVAFLPALKTGEIVELDGSVSNKLKRNIEELKATYVGWHKDFHDVSFEDLSGHREMCDSNNRVAAFFSGGVDSFYTLLKHENEITDLIFVHGFDIDLGDASLREEVSSILRQIAHNFGKNLIEVETNLRESLDQYSLWGKQAHGCALVTIGNLLSDSFNKIYIPATFTDPNLFAWGTHPLFDPLWGTETLSFVHDGCEATRVEKTAQIAKNETVLKTLRVCWKNSGGEYNCGECEKCIRTMIGLHLCGALDKSATFPKKLDLARIEALYIPKPSSRVFSEENIRALRKSDKPGDVAILNSLLAVMRKPRYLGKLLFIYTLLSKCSKRLLGKR